MRKIFRSFVCSFLILLFNFCLSFAFISNPEPGVTTVTNMFRTAFYPCGKTLYVWGGGWNLADTGSGIGSTTMYKDIIPRWKNFFDMQSKGYAFTQEKDANGAWKNIDDGLDCSGYVASVIYNVINTESGKDGYLDSLGSGNIVPNFAKKGWGEFIPKEKVKKHRAGDIMGKKGHVYICIGECDDGSVVLIHSSARKGKAQGVQICGTTDINGSESSKAIKLAEKYMRKYYSEFDKKFYDENYSEPRYARDISYLTDYDQLSWYTDEREGSLLTDPDGLRKMGAEDVLKFLFNENSEEMNK